MENIEFQTNGDQLVIAIDLSHEVGESASGKSMIIATTRGNVQVPGYEEVTVGLNVYRPFRAARVSRRSRS